MYVIVYHLGGPFPVVFPKNKTINYCHVTHFIRLYPGRVITGSCFRELETRYDFLVLTCTRGSGSLVFTSSMLKQLA